MSARESNKTWVEERKIARNASVAATKYVRAKIASSSLQLRGIGSPYKKGKSNKNERLPIIDATYVKPVMGDYRLLGLQFYSNRAGFVHHFGTVRDNTKYLQRHSKTNTVFQKSKPNIKTQAFFDDIYKNSGSLAILESGLARTRTKLAKIQLNNLIIEINKKNG